VTSRRQAVSSLALGAILLPRVVSAQAPAKTPRIGILMSTTPMAAAHIMTAFGDGLSERGHVVGKNVILEYRWAEGRPERIPELADELVRQRMDVLVGSSQAAALALAKATKTIPIVMVNTSDPVQAGLVASLVRPGGNVTGLSQQLTAEIRAKQLQLLKEVLPKASSVAVLWSSSTTVGLKEYQAAAQPLGIKLRLVELKTRDDLGRVFVGIAGDRADALLVPGDTLLFMERRRVVDLAREHRLPAMYSTREFTLEGGLMSYSARLTEQFRNAAGYVDKILRGATPATLPVESPSHYELVINLRTAKALGLTVPPPLLIRADEVIR
jgi:putative ABC transport system substrate-binding protein